MRNYIKPPYIRGGTVFFFDDESENDFAKAYVEAERSLGKIAQSKYCEPFSVWRRFRGMPPDLQVICE